MTRAFSESFRTTQTAAIGCARSWCSAESDLAVLVANCPKAGNSPLASSEFRFV
jgi:hypothetical protein